MLFSPIDFPFVRCDIFPIEYILNKADDAAFCV